MLQIVMTGRRASRLAWSLWAAAMVIGLLSLLFLALTITTRPPDDFGYPGFSVVLAVGFSTVGAVVASRKPGNPIGWLFLAVGLMNALRGLGREYANYALLGRTEPLPGGATAAWLDYWLWVPAVWLMVTFLLLLFPDGRLPSRRWLPVGWIAGGLIVLVSVGTAVGTGQVYASPPVTNPYGLALWEPLQVASFIGFIGLLPAALVCTASLIARFRAAGQTQRQQIKWLILAGAVLGAVLPFGQRFGAAGDAVIVSAMIALPVAVGVAILRYRLYDIDRIINRTIVYGAVVTLLAGVYTAVVFGLRAFLPDSGDLAVAASTLTVAALFNPARKRVQRFIDRRFYRSRYSAQRTVEEFSARLRNELDLTELISDWLTTVDQTVKPASARVWLRPNSDSPGPTSART